MQQVSQFAVLGPTLALPTSCLPSEWEDADWYTKLTVVPRVNEAGGGGAPRPIPTAFVRRGWLHLPRFKGIQLIGGVPGDDRRSRGEALNSTLTFGGTLRDTPPQREATSRVVTALHATGGAMLVLPCGFGKTVCALWVVSTLGRRTLVLVHTSALADQWSERVRTFLPGARVGRIQQDVVDVEGCDVVIGMIQSVVRREYDRSVLSSFGTLVVDEAHHIAAPWFSVALRKLPTRYVLGLSATPDRKDGLGRILPWMLGEVAFRATRSDEECVNVRSIAYVDPPNQWELRDRRGKPRYSEMLTRLATNPERTSFIASLIMEYVNKGRRRLIVLSERRDQLSELERLLGEEEGCVCVTTPRPKPKKQKKSGKKRKKGEAPPSPPPQEEEVHKLETRFTIGRVVGGTPPNLRDAGFEATVLLSTYPYAAEGIDIPRLDTLVMASPGINVEQTVGRILRAHPDKQTPLVVDVKDPFSLFDGMAWKRYKYYASQNYGVTREKYGVTKEKYDVTCATNQSLCM